MAFPSEKRKWSLLVVVLISLHIAFINAEPQVPCFFIFGDSLADNGNNNNLSTLAKVNYKPYGIDFPNGSTGRFTNGRTTVDVLGELLGLEKPIQSFLYSFNSRDLLSGVNYASGSAGILRESGKHLGDNISFRRQVRNHRKIISLIIGQLGNITLAKERLKKCLYWIGIGNNDYINNYFMPLIYPSSSMYNPEQFASLLIEKYQQLVLELYKYGARMVAFGGLGRIGCTPNSINTYGTKNGSTCIDFMNDAVQLFNKKLVKLVDELNGKFKDAKFVYIHSYGSGSGSPTLDGFRVWNVGCCSVNNIGQCVEFKKPCKNRSEYVFWDSFHPTEALNVITAKRMYKAHEPSDSYPMDISSLVKLFGHSSVSLPNVAESTSNTIATY